MVAICTETLGFYTGLHVYDINQGIPTSAFEVGGTVQDAPGHSAWNGNIPHWVEVFPRVVKILIDCTKQPHWQSKRILS